MFNLISFVSAHTGNDAIDHGMTTFDWALGFVMIIGLALLITWRIKRRRKRKH
jgi:hypothetical protein